jgi:hypothetical protein
MSFAPDARDGESVPACVAAQRALTQVRHWMFRKPTRHRYAFGGTFLVARQRTGVGGPEFH